MGVSVAKTSRETGEDGQPKKLQRFLKNALMTICFGRNFYVSQDKPLRGLNMGLFATGGKINGVSLSVFMNMIDPPSSGIAISIMNGVDGALINTGKFNGLLLGLLNCGSVNGVSIGSLNLSGGDNGVSLALFNNSAEYFGPDGTRSRGLIVSGLVNFMNEVKGVLVSTLYNHAYKLHGVMVSGVFNVVEEQSVGIQLGLINICESSPWYARYTIGIAIRFGGLFSSDVTGQ